MSQIRAWWSSAGEKSFVSVISTGYQGLVDSSQSTIED